MPQLDTKYSDRKRYASSFITTTLRQFYFWLWVMGAIACLLILTTGLVYSISDLFSTTKLVTWFANRWNWLRALPPWVQWLGGVIVVLLLARILTVGERHWRTGIQHHWMSKGPIVLSVVLLTLSLLYVIFVLLESMGFVSWPLLLQPLNTPYILLVVALLGVCGLLLISGPRHFLNTQRARWRHLLRPIRHDKIRSEFLPTHDLVHPLNRFLRWRRRVMSLSNYRWIIFLAFVGGFFISVMHVEASTIPLKATVNPSLANILGDLYQIFQAFIVIGLLSVGILAGIGFGTSLLFRRQRYIFTPFGVSGALATDSKAAKSSTADDKTATTENGTRALHLESAAQHMTQQFIEQLEQIGFLLSSRQVEDVHGRERFPLSEFITTGGDDEFIAALQSLVDIDERAKGIPGRLLAAFTKAFAVITLSGNLRQRDDTNLELEIRLTQRFGNQTSIIVPITSPHSSEALLDNTTATRAARRAAVRLLIRSGAAAHLASSEESLDAFLDGLAASSDRNWWRAVASYRQAIQYEESIRGLFGLGRYHLGVALIRQGELASGMRNLEQAERADGPLAETQYMLAVTLLHREWDALDQKDTEFERIARYCHRAAQAQRIFPEVHHLLGAAYYHRGKLFERNATRSYGPLLAPRQKRILEAKARGAYLQAIRELEKAVRHYAQHIRRLHLRVGGSPIITKEIERLRRDRMTATHQLGDALRSATFYPLAESFYGDVLAAYPSNIRTIADISRTLILARNWQRADEFLSREAMILPEGKWDADINFYTGWTFAGGAAELLSTNLLQRAMLNIISGITTLFYWLTDRPDKSKQERPPQPIELVGLAVSHMDFALYQRPRFAQCWRQTDWQSQFLQTFEAYQKKQADAHASKRSKRSATKRTSTDAPQKIRKNRLRPHTTSLKKVKHTRSKRSSFAHLPYFKLYKQPLGAPMQGGGQNSSRYLLQLRAWIAWRLHSVVVTNPAEGMAKLRLYPHKEFALFYEELRYQRRRLIKLLDTIQETGRLHGVKHAQERLELAVLALDNWKLASRKLRTLRGRMNHSSDRDQQANIPRRLSLGERWAHDVFAEISLLTVRLLADAKAYESAWIVAACSVYALDWWIQHWGHVYQEVHSPPQEYISQREVLQPWTDLTIRGSYTPATFRLSPYMSRYHIASLAAWKAYCANRLCDNDQTYARLITEYGLQTQIDQGAFDDLPEMGHLIERINIDNNDSMKRAQAIFDEVKRAMKDDVQIALGQMPRHPLALLMQAWIARDEMRSEQAISELQRLLELLAPYDPNSLIANWYISEKKQPSTMQPDPQPIPPDQSAHMLDTTATEQAEPDYLRIRTRLGKHSRVSGQHQFSHVVSPYIVHEQLAHIFADQGNFNLSVQHLMQALTHSPYWDIDADNLLLTLVQHLDRLDRLRDAHAAMEALRARREMLKTNSLSIAKSYQPDVWECIILSRMGHYAASLRAGHDLQQRLRRQMDVLHAKQEQVYIDRLPHKNTFTENVFKRIWKLGLELSKADSVPDTQQHNIALHQVYYWGLPKSYLGLPRWIADARRVRSTHDDDSEWRSTELIIRNSLLQSSTSETIGETDGLLKHLRIDARGIVPHLDINRNMYWLYINFWGEEAISMVELWAQLYNNMAYNRIELRLQQEGGAENIMLYNGSTARQTEMSPSLGDVDVGMQNGYQLALSDEETTEAWISYAINSLEYLKKNKYVVSQYKGRFLRDLAYYYDTKGWMHYRLARLEDINDDSTKIHLKLAQEALDQAIDYDQRSAVIYYHRARVTLTLMERAWQDYMYKYKLISLADKGNLAENLKTLNDEPNIYLQIDNYLVAVHHYWTLARVHDYNGRFQTRLAWLGLRVEQYRALWKDRNTRLFSDL